MTQTNPTGSASSSRCGYPGDVEPFIERWFAGRPEQGHDLAAQIARRPGLQQAATVPLILAFYCIVGGTGPLPEFRRDLYTRVLNRMLTGRWRDDDDRQPDADTCLQTLRAWAWDGAASHPVSGVGTWADDIPAKRVRLGEADADAVDHVATPLGRPDVDTGTTLRRFIHRSIREHLVAGHVASLPVDQAVKVLLPHLWYDPDWEYAAPAALAMHPQRDQLVRDLICRAASSDQIPGDLSVIDAGWEARGLLARVAAESSEADWSPEIAGMIGQARVELAQVGPLRRPRRSSALGDLGSPGPRRAARAAGPSRPTAGRPDGWRAGWPSSTRRRRTSARPATRCSGCWPVETDSGRPQGWRAGWPSSRRRRRTSARPATRCSGCWPVRPTAGRPQGWRAGWPSSTRRRRTSARPARRCSGCWPVRPTAGRPDSWRAGWPSSTRRRRTSARPATRCSGCWPVRPTAGVAARAGGRAGPARDDGGGQAPGPRRAARAAGP